MSIIQKIMTAAVVCSAACAQAQLVNPGFETPGVGTTFDGWQEFNAGGITAEFSAPHSGSVHAGITGLNADDGAVPPNPIQSDVGLFQELPANAGEYWEASAWVQVPSWLNAADIGILILEFRDGGGGLLNNVVLNVADDFTAPGSYVQHSVTAVAPAGTAAARILLLHVELGLLPRGAQVYWDDASLAEVPAPPGLINPSFEQAGVNEGPAADWVYTGGNAFLWPNLMCDGAQHLAIYGLFNGAPNTTVLYQKHPAAPGETWTAEISTAQLGTDPLAGTNEGFMSIVFRDAGGAALLDSPIIVGQAGDPTDVYAQHILAEVAPAGTATAEIVLGFNQELYDGGALYYDCASFLQDGTDVLLNGGFETNGSSSAFVAWDTFGNNVVRDTVAPNTGGAHGKMWGNFDGAVNYTGATQNLAASPGDVWEASAYGYLDFADGLLGDNKVFIRLTYFDAGGFELQTDEITLLDPNSSPFGVYVQDYVSSTSPAGTAEAQIAIVLEQDAANSGGSAYFDDALLDCLSGDCGAGPVGCSIADVTTTGAGIGDPGYGVPDNEITAADIQYFVNGWVGGDLGIGDVTTTGAGIGDPGYGVPDGFITAADINYYVNFWILGCP